jgi:PAS domain S-box-containing protein
MDKLEALEIKLKRAEEEVQIARERLNYLLSTSPGVIYVCKPSGDYGAIFISENVKMQLGYEARQFIGNPGFWVERIHPEDKPAIFAELPHLFEQDHHTHEYRFLHKDGTYRWMHDRLKLVRNPDGSPLEIVGFWIDITERKRAEETFRESEERLHFLSSHLLTAQETERKRISIELHDELGQGLIALKLRLSSIQRKLRKDQKTLKDECEYAQTDIDQIIENVRRLSQNLSPYLLEDLGLSASLRWMIDDFVKHRKIKASVDIADIGNLFSKKTQLIIYRIFQEVLTNIRKHAHANCISVDVSKKGDSFSFMIEDDGTGFDVREIMARNVTEKGFGLMAMEERARMLGVPLDIRSEVGKGTRISFSVPVSPVRNSSGALNPTGII